jgi:hypothetical protein
VTDENFTFDVFLNYSSKDRATVHRIASRLREDGLRVWLDDWEILPGDYVPAKIEEGLERSRVLVLFISESATNSDWAQLEAGTFRFRDPLNKQRRLIPVRLDESRIRGSLAQIRFIDWHDNEINAYNNLLIACRLAVERPAEPTWGYVELVNVFRPAVIQMILDDSGSMTSPMAATSDRRYAWLETCAAQMLSEFLARSVVLTNGEVAVRPRYFLDVIKYGSTVDPWSVSELDIGEAAKKFDAAGGKFGLGGNLGGTDHERAFRLAHERMCTMIVKDRFRDSFPPIVVHFTDGESVTDAEAVVRKLANLSTSDGNVLVMNVHITSRTSLAYDGWRDFPGYVTSTDVGASEENLKLFRMSSVVPETFRQRLIRSGVLPSIRKGARLFFTADLAALATRIVSLAHPEES